MSLDEQLAQTEHIKKRNWGKLLAVSKRQFDDWATQRLAGHGYEDFKMVYMPVLMNITRNGTNNNDLACHARVTKQAMSKVAKELQKLGYIKAKTSPEDKRSTIFSLTERGKKLVIQARLAVQDLMNEYREVFGKEDFDKMIDLMIKLAEYNDQKFLPKGE